LHDFEVMRNWKLVLRIAKHLAQKTSATAENNGEFKRVKQWAELQANPAAWPIKR